MRANAVRWSGLVLIAGAVLLAAAIVLVAVNPGPAGLLLPVTNYCFLMSALLLLLALPGFYARQADAAGWLGLASYGLLQAGVLLFVVLAAPPLVYSSLSGPIPENAPMFFLAVALTLGLLLTAVATLRARVFPRWTGALLLASTLSFFFGFFVAELLPPMPAFLGQASTALLGVLLGLPIAGWGLALLARPQARPDTEAQRPASAIPSETLPQRKGV